MSTSKNTSKPPEYSEHNPNGETVHKNTEYEKNFYFISKPEILKILSSIPGAKQEKPESLQKRVIFDLVSTENLEIFQNELKKIVISGNIDHFIQFLPQADYLRVRDEGSGKITMSLKIHAKKDGKVSDQKEVEMIVESFFKAINIINQSGLFYRRAYQENKRETWPINRLKTEVYIDTWPGLPTYFEIQMSKLKNLYLIRQISLYLFSPKK